MLLYVLCRIFHRHAVVICDNRYWCSFDNPPDMPIEAILDACDLHLVYLWPGMFGELQLKKCHGSLTSFSPPEFPVWTGNIAANNSDSSPTESTVGDHSTMAIQNTSHLTQPDTSSEIVENINVAVKGGNVGVNPNATAPIIIMSDSNDLVDVDTQQLCPISLKESCCQVLVRSCIVAKPATLFSMCVDYISWHPSEFYKCSMVLPRNMNTSTYMMELLDHKLDQTSPHVIIKQVTLYDDLLVDPRVKDYLLQQAESGSNQ